MKKLLIIYILVLTISLSACNYVNVEMSIQTNPTVPTDTQIIPTEDTIIETEPTKEIIEFPPKNFELIISFAGDCTLSDVTSKPQWHGFESFAKEKEPSYFLEKVKPIFENDDLTVVNLECVLSDRKLSKRDKGSGVAFWFKSNTSKTDILSSSSVEAVSLANNHTFDYGNEGHEDTINAVTNAGLKYGHDTNVIYMNKHGFRVAVICHGLWYESQANDIIKVIDEAESRSDYQIVFYHGGTEKAHAPEEWRIRASRKLVDSGADLVIGNHPHVLQPIETYNGSQIVYSLGNFCYGGHLQPRNRTMIYQMRLTINYKDLQIVNSAQKVIPCYVYTGQYNNYQPTPIENKEEINRVIDFLNGKLDLPY